MFGNNVEYNSLGQYFSILISILDDPEKIDPAHFAMEKSLSG